ncbi:MAG TPA: heme-binding protein [Gemmatimonadales bacterium]|nr:heme-binding protein [Gemmatimonadales bacterium]
MPRIRDLRILTLEGATALADAAEAAARQRAWTVAIAVVNPQAGLIHFRCMDGTQPGSQQVAIEKARTAANFKRPTKALEDALTAGRTGLLSMPGIITLEGGVPVIIDDQIVGAIGISGMQSTQDGIIAAAALEAFAP